LLAFMHWLDGLPLWALGLLLFALFWVAAWVGRLLNRNDTGTEKGGDPSLIISASLGLLALLLGFTVSMAVSRYDLRRTAVLQEANAIGTFLYRTDLMPPAIRAQTLDALDRYLAARVQVGAMGESAETVSRAKAVGSAAQAQMWRAVLAARAAVPEESVKLLIVESANQMFDMATARDAALGNRLPPTLVALLLFFPVASMVLIGYASGRTIGVHLMASTELILLLTLVLLLIADLNKPRSGTIMTPQAPLLELKSQLKAALAAPLS
jgi:hypothetical protein